MLDMQGHIGTGATARDTGTEQQPHTQTHRDPLYHAQRQTHTDTDMHGT